jgi:hypothetical protein
MDTAYPFRFESSLDAATAKSGVKPFVSFLGLIITRACNFRCAHCLQEDSPSRHMSLEDIAFAVEKANNPFLNNILLFGGEPTIHPQFDSILDSIVSLLGRFNKIPRAEDDPALKEAMLQINDFVKANMSEKERRHLSDSGELYNIYRRYHSQLPKGITSLGIATNGHSLLSSREHLVAGIRKMAGMGIQGVSISNDLAHQEYARKAKLGLDYSLIEGCNTWPRPDSPYREIEKEFGEGVYVSLAGNGDYVLPVGRARNMPWKELSRLASSKINYPVSAIKKKLKKEYRNWPSMEFFSHCYCSVVRHFRRHRRAENYRPENAFHGWAPWIDENLNIHLCQFQILPPAGNLRNSSFDEIYEKIIENKMYQTVAEAGPQGLARQLTNLEEEQIREKFLKRTPCGLCEDLISERLA